MYSDEKQQPLVVAAPDDVAVNMPIPTTQVTVKFRSRWWFNDFLVEPKKLGDRAPAVRVDVNRAEDLTAEDQAKGANSGLRYNIGTDRRSKAVHQYGEVWVVVSVDSNDDTVKLAKVQNKGHLTQMNAGRGFVTQTESVEPGALFFLPFYGADATGGGNPNSGTVFQYFVGKPDGVVSAYKEETGTLSVVDGTPVFIPAAPVKGKLLDPSKVRSDEGQAEAATSGCCPSSAVISHDDDEEVDTMRCNPRSASWVSAGLAIAGGIAGAALSAVGKAKDIAGYTIGGGVANAVSAACSVYSLCTTPGASKTAKGIMTTLALGAGVGVGYAFGGLAGIASVGAVTTSLAVPVLRGLRQLMCV